MTTMKKVTVTENWKSITMGSSLLQLKKYGPIYLAAGKANTLPRANNNTYITLNGYSRSFDWDGSDTLYARTDPGSVEDVVVWKK